MEIYIGGQILEKKRGDLAAIITSEKDSKDINVFIEAIGSENYIYLTGIGSIKYPIERAYVGINSEAGHEIASMGDYLEKGQVTLDNIDNLIVTPHFLR